MLFEQWQEYHNEIDENEYLMTENRLDLNKYIEIETAIKQKIQQIERKVQANFEQAPELWQTLIQASQDKNMQTASMGKEDFVNSAVDSHSAGQNQEFKIRTLIQCSTTKSEQEYSKQEPDVHV